MIDRDRGAPADPHAPKDTDESRNPVDVAEARERRADDIIRRKQEERVRSAIKS